MLEQVVGELQLDKSKWSLIKFGDVAIQQKKSVDRDNTDLTRYVKGEHMGSENLHLREWGELTDEYLGPAFIREFEEGDILYGSRRTYLRKVVIAPFSGITSNTTFVIKAYEKRIDKRLLPFIMMSEGFTENSIRNSKGSVNPYINWKDIANYEFLLPPKDQQAKLAELLWAMDEVIERGKELKEVADYLTQAIIKHEITEKYHSTEQRFHCLSEVCEIKGRVGWRGYKKSDLRDYGPYVIGAKHIDDFHRLDLSDPTFLSEDKFEESPEIKVSKNDILVVQRGTLGKIVQIKDEIGKATINPSMVLLKNISIGSNYLFAVLISPYILESIKRISSSTGVPMITQKDLGEFKIPKLDPTQCEYIGNKVKESRTAIELIEKRISNSKAFQKSLINQIF